MNYLAHAYLSFNHPGILTGNMISDFVKGKKKFDYPAAVQKGIELHRMIDRFTDEHEATREAKKIFSPAYRLYSGAFVDVVYDHFLATDTTEFADEESLFRFSQQVYNMLENDKEVFPEKFARMFPYMKEQNWLYNYRTRWGIEKSLGGVVRRSAYLTESDTSLRLFQQHYHLLQDCYHTLWAHIKPFTIHQLEELKRAG
jgi:acyl carrier protein phosphodiesterase